MIQEELHDVRWHFAQKVFYNAFPYQGALRQETPARLDTVTPQLRSRFFFS